jgi:hypothetical protein
MDRRERERILGEHAPREQRALVRYHFEEHPDLTAEPAAAGVEAPKGA